MSETNGTLIVHCGGVRRTRAELAGLTTPDGTKTWTPVPHFELVNRLHDALAQVGALVVAESYCTRGKEDSMVLGTMDLHLPDLATADYRMALGLRAANDRSCSIQLVAAARVFVCDNMAFSGHGGGVFLKRRHVGRLNLGADIPEAVGGFLEKAGRFQLDLSRMQERAITDDRAKLTIYDAFAAGILPCRLLDDVHHLYFDDHEQRDKFRERTLWSLNNAFTEAVKCLGLARQHSAGLAVGRLFGRLVHEADRPDRVTIEIPATVVPAPAEAPEPPAILALPAPAPAETTADAPSDWDLLVDFHD
jgi:hypothetical protein